MTKEIFSKNLIPEQTVNQILYGDTYGAVAESDIFSDSVPSAPSVPTTPTTSSNGQIFTNPRIIGGIFEGGSFRTANSGARVEMFPNEDYNIGIRIKDDAGSDVFKALIGGTDVGDVIIGDSSGQHAKWDKSAATFAITGTVTATAGSIGGWTISSVALYKDGATDAVSSGMAPADYPFYAGKKYVDRATAPFRVTPAGALTASEAIISCSGANAITINYGSDILLKHGGDIKFTSVTKPTACTATLVATDVGNVTAGAHIYKVTYVNETGETELGTASNTVTTDATHKQVDLTAIPKSTSDSVTSRKIYRTKAGGTDYYLLTTIANNTATTYTDNIADADLTGGSVNYKENDTFGKIIIDTIESLSLGWKNVFVGQLAGFAITTGYDNVGISTYALYKNTIGYQNIAIGYAALYENITGYENTAVGAGGVLYSNTSGYHNTAMGAKALYKNTTGYGNLAIGHATLNKNTTGAANIAIGLQALYSNTTGNINTAMGLQALYFNSTGSGNIALGYNAGAYETGSNAFYVNNQDRDNTAGDKAKSILYGVMNADQTLQKLQINANLKIGAGDVRATTVGTRVFDIFDGTAPAGTLANGISLYSTAGELRVMDAAGNATLLSPHDKRTNEWVYDCVDKNGKRLRINMEQMMKTINKKFGWDFIKEFEI